MPFDGDARASYAQLTWQRNAWHAEIIRLGYDRRQAERDFEETGFLEEASAFAQLVLVELRVARSQIFEWMRRYEARVLAGEITMQESVEEFLAGYSSPASMNLKLSSASAGTRCTPP